MTFQEKDGYLSNVTQCFEIMKAAYLGGVNFFDNAEGYASGEAESLMGDAVRMGIENGTWDREDLVVGTKLYFGTPATYKKTTIKVNRMGLGSSEFCPGEQELAHYVFLFSFFFVVSFFFSLLP